VGPRVRGFGAVLRGKGASGVRGGGRRSWGFAGNCTFLRPRLTVRRFASDRTVFCTSPSCRPVRLLLPAPRAGNDSGGEKDPGFVQLPARRRRCTTSARAAPRPRPGQPGRGGTFQGPGPQDPPKGRPSGPPRPPPVPPGPPGPPRTPQDPPRPRGPEGPQDPRAGSLPLPCSSVRFMGRAGQGAGALRTQIEEASAVAGLPLLLCVRSAGTDAR
jgi:hypothetical protein